MATLYYTHQYVTTQLSVPGGISDTDTANITLQDVTGIDTTKPSIALLDYQDPLDLTKAEWITYTSINASKVFQGVTRGAEGSIAREHSDGCAIAFPISESHINNLNDAVIALPTADSTTTFTNKRIEPRIVTAASYTTDTGTSLSVATADIFQVTAQSGALKFNNPGGTPVAGQKLIIRIKDDGTARALTYDTQFRASSDLALPSTTVVSKTLYLGFIFNATDTKWDLLSVLNNF